MKRYATSEYWVRKEEAEAEMARQEQAAKDYEMTEADIYDMRYREARDRRPSELEIMGSG